MYASLRRSSAYTFNTHKQSLENSNMLKCKKKKHVPLMGTT